MYWPTKDRSLRNFIGRSGILACSPGMAPTGPSRSDRSRAESALWESIFPDSHLRNLPQSSMKGSTLQSGQVCIALPTHTNISALFQKAWCVSA